MADEKATKYAACVAMCDTIEADTKYCSTSEIGDEGARFAVDACDIVVVQTNGAGVIIEPDEKKYITLTTSETTSPSDSTDSKLPVPLLIGTGVGLFLGGIGGYLFRGKKEQ